MPPRARQAAATLLAPLALAACAAAPAEPTPQQPELRDLDDDSAPYRTPRSGEGIRARALGDEIEIPPRDRRSVAAWDIGVSSAVRADEADALPFGSLYFWEHPDDGTLFRAVVYGIYNDLLYAKSLDDAGPAEVVGTLETFNVPWETGELLDGEVVDGGKLLWGYVRPGIGIGYRTQVGPGYQDNMFATDLIVEPGLLYFGSGSSTADAFEVPDTTFELRTRLQIRYDALERNLLELPHSGLALGADAVYGWRASPSDWGVPGTAGARSADQGRDYLLLTGYAFGVAPVPLVDSERHRLVGSLHGGVGDGIDRFSAPRVGGGPDPRGDEYGAVARPILPGAAIGEFFPEHYAIGYAGYRWEATFFAHVDVGGTVAWLDRDRVVDGTLNRQDEVLTALSTRLTSGFFGSTRVQLHYAYNFDVVRDGDLGGHEVVVHVSRRF